MGHRITSVRNDKAFISMKEDELNRWRDKNSYFLNKTENIWINKVASKDDIEKMKYKISSSAIYSNHYDGLVIVNITELFNIKDSKVIDDFFCFVAEESMYGEYILVVNEKGCIDHKRIIEAARRIISREINDREV